MFGFYRTYLALWVAAFHLTAIGGIGSIAVFSFYVLSGFLMTLIMVEKYAFTNSGRKYFFLNRFLRIYPSYWVCIFCAFLIVVYCGAEASSQFRENLGIPTSGASIFGNLTLIYPSVLPGIVEPRLCPPSWALTVEILWYSAIAIGLSASKRLTLVWLCLSLVGTVAILFSDFGWGAIYFSLFSGALPFALGAFSYHWKDEIIASNFFQSFGGYFLSLSCFSGLALVAAFCSWKDFDLKLFFLYLSLPFSCWVLLSLYQYKPARRFRDLDRAVGRYSYLIYLLHIPVALLTKRILDLLGLGRLSGERVDEFIVFLVSLGPLFLLSTLIIKVVEIPLEQRKFSGAKVKR